MEEDRPCSWLAADCWEQLTCAIVYVKGTTKQVKDLHCELKGQLSGGKSGSTEDHEDIAQEDKPRSRIMAEYLAHGYVLSDNVVQRALQLDQQHGISSRFTTTLQQFDQRTKATERASQVDQKYGLSARADAGWKGLTSYFEKSFSSVGM